MLDGNWNSVFNWLRNLDLLRAAGLQEASPLWSEGPELACRAALRITKPL
jgi:hypothetical protein